MYARIVMFSLGSGMRSTADELAARFDPAIRARPGFQDLTFFGDDSDGTYGVFTLYDTKENAEAAIAALQPQLQEAIKDILKGPPTLRLFEVIEPGA